MEKKLVGEITPPLKSRELLYNRITMGIHDTLVAAKRNKKDEFYTQLSDIQNECKHYSKHFEGAVICCPCDESENTMFYKYFMANRRTLKWKRLICIGFVRDDDATAHIIDNYGEDDFERQTIKIKGNGDFRSNSTIEYITQSTIVVTNPPFSLWREFISLMTELDKKFLIVGAQTVISNKDVFPMIKENKLWAGHTFNKTLEFEVPDDYEYERVDADGKKYGKVAGICFFTNLETEKREVKLCNHVKYENAMERGWLKKYDNYDAINVDKCAHIPMDYDGVMGVPVTFLSIHNPEQFEIVGLAAGNSKKCEFYGDVPYTPHPQDRGGCGVIDGKRVYSRLFIRKKK